MEEKPETEITRYYETYWSPEGFNPRIELGDLALIFSRFLPTRGRVLDVGCGTGKAGPWLIARGLEYEGVDISANAVELARAAGMRASLIEDASRLPFESNSFDAAICIEVLEHLFSPLNALVEINRILKPGGTLVVTAPNVAYWKRRAELAFLGLWNPFGDQLSMSEPWRDPHIRFFTPASLRRCMAAAGFVDVAVGAHEGAFLGDFPVIRRWLRPKPSRPYRMLMSLAPTLFGMRTFAAGHKAVS